MSQVQIGGTPGVNVMAIRGSRLVTSSGFKSRRPDCDQLSDSPQELEWLLLPEPFSLVEREREPPRLDPPLVTTCVYSPRRLLTYSAVCWSFTP